MLYSWLTCCDDDRPAIVTAAQSASWHALRELIERQSDELAGWPLRRYLEPDALQEVQLRVVDGELFVRSGNSMIGYDARCNQVPRLIRFVDNIKTSSAGKVSRTVSEDYE